MSLQMPETKSSPPPRSPLLTPSFNLPDSHLLLPPNSSDGPSALHRQPSHDSQRPGLVPSPRIPMGGLPSTSTSTSASASSSTSASRSGSLINTPRILSRRASAKEKSHGILSRKNSSHAEGRGDMVPPKTGNMQDEGRMIMPESGSAEVYV
ncbi:hypothetical protein M231_03169 [Tremella mesenterica]|uniref:Uncharacterized protein n=1 Tax=Tremella mesenterica TaxID=5217 RepID=A0A4Q1BNZ7_TREME|nr:hypothetical protein M231_03169 [Tremella mesenterica]